MRVLYLTQYFPPEIGATQTRAREMASGLVRAGHEVTVVTEFPNHPHGVIPAEYRGRMTERTTEDGVDVLRVRVLASPKKSFTRRMGFYLSYSAMATLAALFRTRGRYDVIYATSPPLFTGMAALALRRAKRLPLVFEVRDLWPDAAIELGEVRSDRAIRMSRALEHRCYSDASRIVAVSRGIRDRIVELGGDEAKLAVVPNGVNVDRYRKRPRDPAIRRGWGVPDDAFVVGYTGLLGLAHGLEVALETAERFRDDPTIRFVFLGDGPRKEALQEDAARRALPNVTFADAVPDEELARHIAAIDLGLDTRRRIGISRGTLPVKMFSYLACEVPAVLAVEGEAADLLRDSGGGRAVPPEDPEALARAISELRSDSSVREEMGRRGRRFVEERFSRAELARRLGEVLEEAAR